MYNCIFTIINWHTGIQTRWAIKKCYKTSKLKGPFDDIPAVAFAVWFQSSYWKFKKKGAEQSFLDTFRPPLPRKNLTATSERWPAIACFKLLPKSKVAWELYSSYFKRILSNPKRRNKLTMLHACMHACIRAHSMPKDNIYMMRLLISSRGICLLFFFFLVGWFW